MKHILLTGLVAAAFGTLDPVQAKTLELEPTSEWKLREYDDKCRISRSFGSGDDRVTLWFHSAGGGRYLNITAIGRPFRSPYGPRITLAFPPGEAQSRGYITSTSSKGRPVLTMFGVPVIAFEKDFEESGQTARGKEEETADTLASSLNTTADPATLLTRLQAVQSFDLSGALIQDVSLKTDGMAEAIDQLMKCTSVLPERRANAQASETSRARGAVTLGERDWAVKIGANYPSHLLRESKEGTVGVRVQVNSQGRATFCEVTNYNGAAGFDDSACLAMIRHSRFIPALDSNGEPTWGKFSTRITYRLNR